MVRVDAVMAKRRRGRRGPRRRMRRVRTPGRAQRRSRSLREAERSPVGSAGSSCGPPVLRSGRTIPGDCRVAISPHPRETIGSLNAVAVVGRKSGSPTILRCPVRTAGAQPLRLRDGRMVDPPQSGPPWMSEGRSGGTAPVCNGVGLPASITSPRAFWSSDSRAAMTDPEAPAHTTMKSDEFGDLDMGSLLVPRPGPSVLPVIRLRRYH